MNNIGDWFCVRCNGYHREKDTVNIILKAEHSEIFISRWQWKELLEELWPRKK